MKCVYRSDKVNLAVNISLTREREGGRGGDLSDLILWPANHTLLMTVQGRVGMARS